MPIVPAGLPNFFSLGLNNKSTGTTDLAWMTGSGVPWNYRYIYLSSATGGVSAYISDSIRSGYIPVITWYNAPTLANLNDNTFMNSYYTNFATAFTQMKNWNLWYLQKSGSSLVTFSADNTSITYTGASGTDDPVLSGNFHGTGKWVFRIHLTTVGGTNVEVGLGSVGALTSLYLGQTAASLGILGNGTGLLINDVLVNAQPALTLASGDDVDVAVDFDAKLIWARRNSGNWNGSASNDPATAVGGVSISAANFSNSNPFSPGVNLHFNGDQASFGTPPAISGFAAWNSSPSSPAMILHHEPDLFGFLQQQGGAGGTQTDNPTLAAVSVAASGYSGLGSLPNTAAGFAQAIKLLRDTNAPGVYIAWHCSTWATNSFVATNSSFVEPPATTGSRIANFYNALGAKFDLIFHDTTTGDRDADYGILVNSANLAATAAVWWWTATAFENYRQLLLSFHNYIAPSTFGFLWQIPIGNTLYKSCNNTANHYQDNKVEFFLTQGAGVAQSAIYDSAAIRKYIAAGIMGMMFGKGQATNTSNYDAAADGITNPASITNGNGQSGNNATATVSDDDGGFLRFAAANYYTLGPTSLGDILAGQIWV